MTEEVTGIWEGKYATGVALAYEAYGGAFNGFDQDLEIRRIGTPGQEYDVKLMITSQDEYRQFDTWWDPPRLISIVSGHADYSHLNFSEPVSGFVDNFGFVKLSFYVGAAPAGRIFIGRLTNSGLGREISGNVMEITEAGTSWADRFTSYYFATLSVTNVALGVDYRAYTVDYGHVF